MSVFTEKGTETDKPMTGENWKTGRHPGTIVTVSKLSGQARHSQGKEGVKRQIIFILSIPSSPCPGLWRK